MDFAEKIAQIQIGGTGIDWGGAWATRQALANFSINPLLIYDLSGKAFDEIAPEIEDQLGLQSGELTEEDLGEFLGALQAEYPDNFAALMAGLTGATRIEAGVALFNWAKEQAAEHLGLDNVPTVADSNYNEFMAEVAAIAQGQVTDVGQAWIDAQAPEEDKEEVISEDVVSDLEAEQQETIETVDEAPVTTTVETVDETVDEAPVTTTVETIDETVDEAPVTTTVETVDETPVTTTVETVDETPVTTTDDTTTTSSGAFSNWASAFSKDKEVDFWLSDPEAFATEDKYANRVGLSIDDIRNLFELRFGNSPSDEELRDYVSTIIESSRLSDWSSYTKNSYIDKILSGEYIVNVEEDQGDLLYQTLGYENKQEYDDLAAEAQAAEEDLLAEDEDLLGTVDPFLLPTDEDIVGADVVLGGEEGIDTIFIDEGDKVVTQEELKEIMDDPEHPLHDWYEPFPDTDKILTDAEGNVIPEGSVVLRNPQIEEEAGGGGATDATEAADTGEAAEATDEAAEATDATQTDVTSTTDDSGEGGMLTGGEDVQDRPFALPNGPWVYIGNGRWVQIDPDVLAQEGVVTEDEEGKFVVDVSIYENDDNWVRTAEDPTWNPDNPEVFDVGDTGDILGSGEPYIPEEETVTEEDVIDIFLPTGTEEVTTVPTEEVTTVPTEEVTTVPTEEVTTVPTEEVTTVPTEEVTTVPTEEVTTVPTEEVTEEIITDTVDTATVDTGDGTGVSDTGTAEGGDAGTGAGDVGDTTTVGTGAGTEGTGDEGTGVEGIGTDGTGEGTGGDGTGDGTGDGAPVSAGGMFSPKPFQGYMGGLSYQLPEFVGVYYQPRDYDVELNRIIQQSLFQGMY